MSFLPFGHVVDYCVIVLDDKDNLISVFSVVIGIKLCESEISTLLTEFIRQSPWRHVNNLDMT